MNRTLLAALTILLVAMTLVAYLPVYRAGFVEFDDPDYVRDNQHVRTGLTWDNVSWAFTRQHVANWHPLTWISHILDVEMFGLEPRGHHVVNVVLHTVNVVLLFFLLRAMTGDAGPSFFVAALFAVHPVNVESVAWIAQRKTTLSTLFALLTLGTYARYARTGSRRVHGASLALFAASLLCKQTWVTMPLLLLLLDYWPLRQAALEPPGEASSRSGKLARGWSALVKEKLPYVGLVVVACGVTLFVQQQAIKSLDSHPLVPRLGNALLAYAGYLGELVWPVRLAVFYPFVAENVTLPRVLAAFALIAGLTAACCWFGRRDRYLLVGWLWFLIALVPMVGLVQVGDQSMADRYAYTAFWGPFIAIAWGARRLLTRLSGAKALRLATCGAAVAILCTCATMTYLQAGHWQDTITLFADAVNDTQGNALALNNLAWQLATTLDPERRNPTEALRLAEQACEASHRENLPCLDTLATCYALVGRTDDAILVCREGLEKAAAANNAVAVDAFQKSLQAYETQGKRSAVPPEKVGNGKAAPSSESRKTAVP